MSQANVLLQVQDLRVAYGGIQAVKGVSFEVREGELVSLIGSNGAGKTTTMKAITGSLQAAGGRISYLGRDVHGQGPWDLVKQGLVMVPEGRGVFTRMSILENLHMGAYLRNDKAGINADIERVFALFPRLKERSGQLSGTLSGGEQQMLAMGRALLSRPKLLLLDEPSMGLSPIMVDKIFEVIAQVAAMGVTVLLVEQNASRALKMAQRAYVMESGEISMQGEAKTLLHDPKVRAAYLGE
ncbi:LivF ABC-type branched-chain amino acid transport systems, ATPase component [Burkholderiaceae bacterium]|jgi:branched-chain amino acid transport system ATP-binding protein